MGFVTSASSERRFSTSSSGIRKGTGDVPSHVISQAAHVDDNDGVELEQVFHLLQLHSQDTVRVLLGKVG